MSSDDMISILRVGTKFFGYRIIMSEKYVDMEDVINRGGFEFEAVSVEDAIIKAQLLTTEFGYGFHNMKIPTEEEKGKR